MKKAHLDYINYAMAQDFTISVFAQSEGYVLKRSKSYKAIKEELEAYDDIMELVVRNKEGEQVGVAVVILEWNQEPDESISDYTVTPYNTQWEKQYYNH